MAQPWYSTMRWCRAAVSESMSRTRSLACVSSRSSVLAPVVSAWSKKSILAPRMPRPSSLAIHASAFSGSNRKSRLATLPQAMTATLRAFP